MEAPPRLECYPSPIKLLGLLGLTAVMVGVSYFCTTLAEWTPRLFGWIGVGFFSLGFIAIPRAFLRRGPAVIIDRAGIEDRRTGLGAIPWDEILSVWVANYKSTRFLCIDLARPDDYVGRMSRWARWLVRANALLGFPPLTIAFSGLSPGIDAAWAFIEARVQEREEIGIEREEASEE